MKLGLEISRDVHYRTSGRPSWSVTVTLPWAWNGRMGSRSWVFRSGL